MKTVLLASAALFVVSLSNGATITWEDYDITSDVSEVSTLGTVVDAANLTSSQQKTANATLTFAGTTFVSRDGLLGYNFNNDQWSTAATGGTPAERTAYDKFLSYLDYSATQGAGVFFTLRTWNGLTVGQEYLVQVWYAAPLPPVTTRTMTLLGTAATTDSNILQAGEYAIGTFIADGTGTQLLRMRSSESGLRCTGFQLRALNAEITWVTNPITGSRRDVVNRGTTVKAVNCTDNVFAGEHPLVTVNSVQFTSTGVVLPGNWAGDPWAPAADAEYDKLLSHIDWAGIGTDMVTIDTFTSLTIGEDYTLQVWFTDSAQVRTMTLDSFGGTDTVLDGTTYGVGTFTATSTTQAFNMKANESGPRLAAYQLRHTPPLKGAVIVIY